MPNNTTTAERRYVLVTPAKDEEATIAITIESVCRQTILPAEWVIVSDGSTDRTDQIVSAAAAQHPWIRLLALPPRSSRSFAAVVHATETGIRDLQSQDYRYLGLLDSDLRFEPDYFERVMAAFEKSPSLGLAGAMVVDLGQPKDHIPRNRQDIPGAAQFFRRECLEGLGGLVAIPEGGWDALTCARARMIGYETRLLTDLVIDHLKPRNVSEGGIFSRHWQYGVRDYALGYHPLLEGLKCLDRFAKSPMIVGSLARALGFGWSILRRRPRAIPEDLLNHIQNEHKARIRRILKIFVPGQPSQLTVLPVETNSRS